MSTSAASEAYREDWRHEDYATLESMQPSDEWEGSRAVDTYCRNSRGSIDIGTYSAPDDEISQHVDDVHHDVDYSVVDEQQQQQPASSRPNVGEKQPESSSAAPTKEESFVSNKASYFVDYLSHLTSSFSVEGSKLTNYGASYYSNATFPTFQDGLVAKKETKAKKSGSNHSRCIIENTESIQERQDRRDEHKQNGGVDRGERGGEEDCNRDQSTMSCSVEEISQISELTMDIPTVATEQHHKCTLPTISEVKQFESPQVAAMSCAAGVRNKAHCSAGKDTTTNKSDGNNDIIDFVFELVEDAFCKPVNTSKSERKKVFMEAFYEESEKVVKLAKKSGSKKAFRETSKHTRSSSSTKPTGNYQPERYSPIAANDNEGSVTDPMDGTATPEFSSHSARRSSEHSRMKIVDKPPVQAAGFRTLPAPHDEELTMDWSKMMSLAEKQLEAEKQFEAEESSVVSEISRVSRELFEKESFYTSMRCDQSYSPKAGYRQKAEILIEESAPKAVIFIDQTNTESAPTSSFGHSNSTHASLAESVVQELRELSALDSSSFEEQSRFLFTTSLFRIMRHLIPSSSQPEEEYEERAFDEVSENGNQAEVSSATRKTLIGPRGETFYESASFKIFRFVAFFCAFIFWPYGIARRSIQFQPLGEKKKRTESIQISLLQLVCDPDAV